MSRVLFHVQHLLGVGHLRRAEIVASAMRQAGLDVTVALGGPPSPEVPFADVAVAQLPPARIADTDFSVLRDERGRPVDDLWRRKRTEALLALFHGLRPDVVMIELFPFGRRQFAFELVPLVEAAAAAEPRPRVVCSVRDILVASRKPGRDAAIVRLLRGSFDAVLVHADPLLISFGATFPAASDIADLIRYTGYVSAEPGSVDLDAGRGEVVVSAGGGAVGAPLLLAAAEARPLTPVKDHLWRFLAGPSLPAETFARLAAMRDSRTIVERFRPDFGARLAHAALSISQAGYNTTMDILRSGVRSVVVPFETPSETEQRLRSDLLARRGLLTVVPSAELSPERLAAAIARALGRDRGDGAGVDMAGAATTARLVGALAVGR